MNMIESQDILAQSVGIDVSADTLEVRIGTAGPDRELRFSRSRSLPNTEEGFQALLEWARSQSVAPEDCWFIMEATGVYYEQLAYWLHQAGLSVCVLVAHRAKHYAKSLPIKSKTDPIDARVLARYGLERRPRRWQPGSPRLRQIKALLRERTQLQDQRTQLTNRRHAARRAWNHPSSSWRPCGSPTRPWPIRSGASAR
ncbi:transposase [Aliifodinibius sp. S!AR15-10]|uniref:IS110 family transposase n=1 Tax=Aliifodinibius sp. S!AR15-10 TaxID=2950437 RepID=UPI002866DDD1|nr:transposase [Aliifodinibius sp. S!AR15-10]MDR8394682.1 transposase [Aliifodinibius sp. S!AR15-10]